MYERFKTSLIRPQFIFKYINDSFSKVFSYVIFLTLLLSLSVITVTITDSSLLFPNSRDLELQVLRNFVSDDIEISNKELINPNNANKRFVIGKYTYIIGDSPTEILTNVVYLEETRVVFYLTYGGGFNQVLSSKPYSQDLLFESSNAKLIVKEIDSVYLNNNLLIQYEFWVSIVANLVTILMMALFFTLLAFGFNRIPLKIGNHFKISIYILTVWVFATMVGSLFGLSILSDIALFILIIYQNITYRTARVLSSIGAKKNEEK